MFTGIVTAVGEVKAAEPAHGLVRLTIQCPYDPQSVAIGASIAHNGCCLTVVEAAPRESGLGYVVEAAAETLALTTIGELKAGDRVNLEQSLRVGDELGGHFMLGHVDGVGQVLSVRQDGAGWRIKARPPEEIAHLIAQKGSIAIDGVSLTVNEVDEQGFGVLIIPHTWAVTTLSRLKPGARVNLEADMMARYAARLMEARRTH
jgi:riboflavin synthase